MSALLGGFSCEVLRNPAETALRDRLKKLKGSMMGGPLMLMWSGHGVGSVADSLRLLATDSDADAVGGLGVSDVAGPCALSGAAQVLFVIDTCFSGAGVAAGEVAHRLMQTASPQGRHVWVGVLTSCMDVETARDGLFGRVLRKVLEEGPDDPDLRVTRWSKHSRFVRGDDVCDGVLKEWTSDVQRPEFAARGSAWWMFENPLWEPGAPEQVVEHLLLAARGGHRTDERSWFTGRTNEVNQVVAWVTSTSPGLHVVTGSAGTGKSAIAGRVVSLSNPQERQRLLNEGHAWEHDDPGERSVHAHAHARGLTSDRLAEVLADQLVTSKVLQRQDAPRNASELVGQVQSVVEHGAQPPVLVIDGLDEARGEAFAIAEDLLVRLARFAVVIVSTRELSRGDERPSLLGILAPEAAAVDLDDPAVQARGQQDVAAYVAARLSGVAAAMDPVKIGDYLAGIG
ncbi:ATP-binding protein [Actinoallomurus sp. NPDC052308]|uniref:ATP-binding protein n=1 Tax=Actinoallomurus sp. NPDC052308 TaxID=3155530 RepID=UPI00342EAFD0